MADSEKVSSLASERAVLLRAMAEKWHDEETLGDATCDHRELEIHAYIAGYSAASAGRQELLEALRTFRQASNTLQVAQQDGVNVHGALSAFLGARDMADAAIQKATGEQQ